MIFDNEYTPFGDLADESDSDNTLRKFTGKDWDAEADLNYYGSRYR